MCPTKFLVAVSGLNLDVAEKFGSGILVSSVTDVLDPPYKMCTPG